MLYRESIEEMLEEGYDSLKYVGERLSSAYESAYQEVAGSLGYLDLSLESGAGVYGQTISGNMMYEDR